MEKAEKIRQQITEFLESKGWKCDGDAFNSEIVVGSFNINGREMVQKSQVTITFYDYGFSYNVVESEDGEVICGYNMMNDTIWVYGLEDFTYWYNIYFSKR